MNGEYYVYGMRLRGFSPGAQPMEGLIKREETPNSDRYYDIVTYNRSLAKEEVEHYDLEIIERFNHGVWETALRKPEWIPRERGERKR